jgi:hypothetical protein
MWNCTKKHNCDRNSFYLGGHAGRPGEMTNDDLMFANITSLPFKNLEYMEYYGFLNEIRRLPVGTPIKAYENVIAVNNDALIASEREKLTLEMNLILKEERTRMQISFDVIIKKLEHTISEQSSKLADTTANLNGSKLIIAELEIKFSNEMSKVGFLNKKCAELELAVVKAGQIPPEVTFAPIPTPEITVVASVPTPEIAIAPVPIPEITIAPIPTPEIAVAPIPTPEIAVAPIPTVETAAEPIKISTKLSVSWSDEDEAAKDDLFKPHVEHELVLTDDIDFTSYAKVDTSLKITIIDNCEFIATDNELVILVAPPGIFRNAILDVLKAHYKPIKKVSEIAGPGRFITIVDEPCSILTRYVVFEIDKARVLEKSTALEKKTINEYFKNFKMPVEKNNVIVNKFKL